MEVCRPQKACPNVIEDLYKYVIMWDVLLTELKGLETLETRSKAIILATNHLTDEYHEALSRFAVVENIFENHAEMDLRISAATTQLQ